MVRVLAYAVLLCITHAFVRADAATHAELLKERDAVLSQILSQEEARRTSGLRDDEAIFAAKLALYSFRRDSAVSKEEKVRQQMLIVSLYEPRLDLVKARAETGIGSPVEVLRATDALLAAKQVLEELRLDEKAAEPAAGAKGQGSALPTAKSAGDTGHP